MPKKENLSTQYQPKGAALNQSATLDGPQSDDSRDVTAESRRKQEAMPKQKSKD
jgi:hypothetical protein